MKAMTFTKHKIDIVPFYASLGELKLPSNFLFVLFGEPTLKNDDMICWDLTIHEDGEESRSYCISYIFNGLVKSDDFDRSKPYTFSIMGIGSVKTYGTSQLRNYMTSTLITDKRSQEFINIVLKYLV